MHSSLDTRRQEAVVACDLMSSLGLLISRDSIYSVTEMLNVAGLLRLFFSGPLRTPAGWVITNHTVM